jgi:translation initiation factor 2 subunit 1
MTGKKKGIPEESDLVLCTVTKIYPHSVFASLDDYEDKQGMIHISEIAPGRIRNINDYVRIGKKIVCKVLKIDHERGHIDLSLRRVSEGQKRDMAEQIKRQQKTEKIVEYVAQQLKIDKVKLFDELVAKTHAEFESLNDVFDEFISDENVLKKLGLPANVYDKLSEVIRQRIKPPEIEIEGDIKLKSYAADGLSKAKKILSNAAKLNPAIMIRYKGGGSYSIKVIRDNFKDAEKILEQASGLMAAEAKKNECEFSFQRVDPKKQQKKVAVAQ